MFHKKVPHMGRRVEDVRQSMNKYSVYYKPGLDPSLKELIQNMLESNAHRRFSLREILSHELIYPEYLKIMQDKFPGESIIEKQKEEQERQGGKGRQEARNGRWENSVSTSGHVDPNWRKSWKVENLSKSRGKSR